MKQSHVRFTSQCQAVNFEERLSVKKNKSYWILSDSEDVRYCCFAPCLADILRPLFPETDPAPIRNRFFLPLLLEGFVSFSKTGSFLCITKVFIWDQTIEDFVLIATAENEEQNANQGGKTDELPSL